MGKLHNGQWTEASIITSNTKGSYKREVRTFRNFIRKGEVEFPPESGRYHLYVSYACPWAQRTLIFRKLKELENHISVSVVHPDMLNSGWSFDSSFEGATGDSLYGAQNLYEIYLKADPKVSTSVTVPVLWDKKAQTIVNNESSEIIRMLNTEFNDLTGNQDNYYPENLRTEIDALNDKIYNHINNGVYKTGFSKTQETYNEAVESLFSTLDEIETLLEGKQFLIGDVLTEADLRLITTLLRFDIVYVTHFKCNVRRIMDYKNLSRYTKNIYKLDAVKGTTNFEHIKRHYFFSHQSLNPYRIIPKGPAHIL